MDALLDNFNVDNMANTSLPSTTDTLPHIYSANEISLMLAAFGACVASVIYSFKHVKSSSCCGTRCEQAVEGVIVQDVMPPQPPPRLETNV